MDEKLGTHLNAPSMYQHREGTMTAEALPLSMLVRAQGQPRVNGLYGEGGREREKDKKETRTL